MKRYAIVGNARTRREVEAYMPDNYRVIAEVLDGDGDTVQVIEGRDVAGWTLDGYVIPRLASGMLYATEIDLSHPIMKKVPA